MRKCIFIITMIFVISSFYIYALAVDITDLQQESGEIVQNLSETNNRLQIVQEELSDNMERLKVLDDQIAEYQEELDKTNDRINNLNEQIRKNESNLKKVQKEYNEIEETLNMRLIQMYEAPQLQFLQILFESKSITQFLSTYYALKDLAEFDKELLEKVKKQKIEIEETKILLNSQSSELSQDLQSIQKKTQVITNNRTLREFYLNKLTEEERELQNKIDEYNIQIAGIENEIKLLAMNSISSDYLGGAMNWPVPGYNKLTSTYGMRVHPITGAYKLHTGIDISAPLNAVFQAAGNGIVTKATYNAAYGNMVIIDHGGGVQTLYAHGNEILVELGQVVSVGTPVLHVGSTGYSTGPHAHFEIRINGQTVDPVQYLHVLGQKENNEQTNE